MLSFKPVFSLSSFTFIKKFFFTSSASRLHLPWKITIMKFCLRWLDNWKVPPPGIWELGTQESWCQVLRPEGWKVYAGDSRAGLRANPISTSFLFFSGPQWVRWGPATLAEGPLLYLTTHSILISFRNTLTNTSVFWVSCGPVKLTRKPSRSQSHNTCSFLLTTCPVLTSGLGPLHASSRTPMINFMKYILSHYTG